MKQQQGGEPKPKPKKKQYPYLAIYAKFTAGNHWSKDEPFSNRHSRANILQRMAAWKARNEATVKYVIIWEHNGPGAEQVVWRSPNEYRLWLKYSSEFFYRAESDGVSVIRRSVAMEQDPGPIMGQLLQIAATRIDDGELWQAKMYAPDNTLLFDWHHVDGERQPGNWLDWIRSQGISDE